MLPLLPPRLLRHPCYRLPRRCHHHAPRHRVHRPFQSPIESLCVALCFLIRESLLSPPCPWHVLQALVGAISDTSHSMIATVINSSTMMGINNQYRHGSCSFGIPPKANAHGSSQVHPEGWITPCIIDQVSRALHDHTRLSRHHRHWVHRDTRNRYPRPRPRRRRHHILHHVLRHSPRDRPHLFQATVAARTLATATVATTAVAVTAFTLAGMPAPRPVSHIMEPLLTRKVVCSSLFFLPVCFVSSLSVLLIYP